MKRCWRADEHESHSWAYDSVLGDTVYGRGDTTTFKLQWCDGNPYQARSMVWADDPTTAPVSQRLSAADDVEWHEQYAEFVQDGRSVISRLDATAIVLGLGAGLLILFHLPWWSEAGVIWVMALCMALPRFLVRIQNRKAELQHELVCSRISRLSRYAEPEPERGA